MKYHIILFLTTLTIVSYGQKKYNSLSWKISGNGLEKDSYLYGTFHTADKRVFEFKDGVEEAFNQADTYAMELNMDSVDKGAMMKAMVMDSNQTLKTLLTEKDYQMVNQFFIDSIGMSLFLFNKMQPFMTTQMVVMKDLKSEQESALDLYWFNKAKKQGKQLVGLETMVEQINTFKSISVEKQAEQLVKSVKDYGKVEAMNMDEMVEIYQSGDLDRLMLEMDRYSEESKMETEDFNEKFLYRRNINMADRVVQYLKKGSVFIAVGAAHLPGEKGVIELLRAKGYTIEVL
jgi:hypothetical protein